MQAANQIIEFGKGSSASGSGTGAPTNALLAEDGTTFLLAEDGATFLTQES